MATTETVADPPNVGLTFSLWPFSFGKKGKTTSSGGGSSKGTSRLTATGSGSPSKGARKVSWLVLRLESDGGDHLELNNGAPVL